MRKTLKTFEIKNLFQRDWRGAVLPLAFLLIWTLVTSRHWVNTRLIVPPAGVFKVAWQSLTTPAFLRGVAASLARDAAGFIMGASAGIVIGSALGLSRWTQRLVGPTFHTMKQVSLFAWIPLLTTWVGSGDGAKVIFIAMSVVYPVALNTCEGVHSVALAQVEVARVYAFTRRQLLTRLILPASASQILTGLHIGLIYAWLATIGSEFLLQKSGIGLGDTINRGRAAFNVELIVFGMVFIGLVGTAFNQVATRIEARVLRWREERQ